MTPCRAVGSLGPWKDTTDPQVGTSAVPLRAEFVEEVHPTRPRRPCPAREFGWGEKLAPRLGFTHDPLGDSNGRSTRRAGRPARTRSPSGLLARRAGSSRRSAFERLRHPIPGPTVAKVATLQQAARIGGLDVRSLVARLRAVAGSAALQASGTEVAASGTASGRCEHAAPGCVDADAILAMSEHLLGQVRRRLLTHPGREQQLRAGPAHRHAAAGRLQSPRARDRKRKGGVLRPTRPRANSLRA